MPSTTQHRERRTRSQCQVSGKRQSQRQFGADWVSRCRLASEAVVPISWSVLVFVSFLLLSSSPSAVKAWTTNPASSRTTMCQLASGPTLGSTTRTVLRSTSAGSDEAEPAAAASKPTTRIRRKLADALRQMKAPASTTVPEPQPGVGGATANGDHHVENSKPNNGGGSSGSAIMSKLGERLRSITAESAPSVSTHGIYQINSDTQHR